MSKETWLENPDYMKSLADYDKELKQRAKTLGITPEKLNEKDIEELMTSMKKMEEECLDYIKDNTKFYLVKYCANYADEFDVDSIRILDKNEYEFFQKCIKFLKMSYAMCIGEDDIGELNIPVELIDGLREYYYDNETIEFTFGTNETIEHDNVYDFCNSLTIKEITFSQYEVLKELNLCELGTMGDVVYDLEEKIFYDLRDAQVEELEELIYQIPLI